MRRECYGCLLQIMHAQRILFLFLKVLNFGQALFLLRALKFIKEVIITYKETEIILPLKQLNIQISFNYSK